MLVIAIGAAMVLFRVMGMILLLGRLVRSCGLKAVTMLWWGDHEAVMRQSCGLEAVTRLPWCCHLFSRRSQGCHAVMMMRSWEDHVV